MSLGTGLYTEEEYDKLIFSFTKKNNPTEEETINFVRWCEEAKITHELINLVLDGIVHPLIDEVNTGDYLFINKFSETEQETLIVEG